MIGYIKVISSLLLVYVISLNTTYENRKLKLHPGHKRVFKRYGTTSQYKGHGQICLTWGGINGTSVVGSVSTRRFEYLLYLLRFSSEYKYFFNRRVGIVPRFGVLDGWYYNSSAYDCHSLLSLGVGLEWSYNGTGSNSRINKTYYGGSIGVLGLRGNTIDTYNKKIEFELDMLGVQVRLTPFKMCKPNGFYMSVDFGGLDIRGLMSSDPVGNGIMGSTMANLAVNIGWGWWI